MTHKLIYGKTVAIECDQLTFQLGSQLGHDMVWNETSQTSQTPFNITGAFGSQSNAGTLSMTRLGSMVWFTIHMTYFATSRTATAAQPINLIFATGALPTNFYPNSQRSFLVGAFYNGAYVNLSLSITSTLSISPLSGANFTIGDTLAEFAIPIGGQFDPTY